MLVDFVTFYGVTLNYAHATVHVMLYAVRFMHVAEDRPDPLREAPTLTMAMKGLRRIQGAGQRKIPGSIDIVRSAVETLDLATWDGLITAAAISAMYVFLLRSGEALRKGTEPDAEKCLRVESLRLAAGGELVSFDDAGRADEMILIIGKSKADQDGQGSVHNAFETDDPLCPVKLIRRACEMRPSHFARGTNFLFTRSDGKVVPRDTVAGLLRQGARHLGINPEAVSVISLRSGGASAMWHAGCSVEEIKRRGRWASDCWKGYIWEGRERNRDLAARMLTSSFTLMASLARYERQERERVRGAQEK